MLPKTTQREHLHRGYEKKQNKDKNTILSLAREREKESI